MLYEQLTQLAEVILETARGDDLDDAAGLAAGVPHGVHLAARFGDVTAGAEDDFAVVRAEADLARQHNRVLVLAGVPVRRSEQAHLEWMLDDGHLAAIGAARQ